MNYAVHYNTEDGQNIMWNKPSEYGDILSIHPGETLLAHTEEVIGGRNIIATEMRAKSTTGRYGLSVCKCAGLGDIGFVSRWTMEITNHSNYNILIKAGERIAQIIFHLTEEPFKQYAGRYGSGVWTPEDMLPKTKKS
jgi:dCTP deaminase